MPSLSATSSSSSLLKASEMFDTAIQYIRRFEKAVRHQDSHNVTHHEVTDHEFESLIIPKGPTKCSQCVSFIYMFEGATCKKCKLAVHKNCLSSSRYKCTKSSAAHFNLGLPHHFEPTTFTSLTYCKHCGELILAPGYRCPTQQAGCGLTVHADCLKLVCKPCRPTEQFASVSVEDFDLIDKIGTGSFSRVYLAKMKQDGRRFALKVVEKANSAINSVMTEMKVLQMGNHHPFLPTVHCCFQTASRLFFVMEYIDGENLLIHLQEAKKFTEDRCRFYSAEIVLALRYLHDEHLVYRDLKLENVIIGRDGHCKLTDFGLSKFINQSPSFRTRTFCGTPYYISPEAVHKQEYGFECDYWALGVLMYELLVGVLPFNLSDASEEGALYRLIVEEPLHVPSYLHKSAQNVLKGLLTRDPKRRLVWKSLEKHPFFCFENRDGTTAWQWCELIERKIKPPSMPVINRQRKANYEPPHEIINDKQTSLIPCDPFSDFSYCSSSFQSLLENKAQR